MNFSRFPE